MNWLRRIAWHFGWVQLCVLYGNDGTVTLRIIHKCRDGHKWAKRYGLGVRNVGLKSNGTVTNCSYMDKWELYAGQSLSVPCGCPRETLKG